MFIDGLYYLLLSVLNRWKISMSHKYSPFVSQLKALWFINNFVARHLAPSP